MERNEHIWNLYVEEGLTLRQVGDEVGLTGERVRQILLRMGHKPNSHNLRKLVEDNIDCITERLKNYETVSSIATSYGVQPQSLNTALKRVGIRTSRERGLRSTLVNHRFFEGVWSDEQYYVAGWIASDGSINDQNYDVAIYQSNYEMLDKLSRLVGNEEDRRPTIYKDSSTEGHYSLHFHSSAFVKALEAEGITPRKSKTIVVSDKLASHPVFWRGYLAGNGYVGINGKGYPITGITSGSADLIDQFETFCLANGVRTYTQHIINDWGQTYQVHILGGLRGVSEFLKLIYEDSTPLTRYTRKYNKAEEILQMAA